MDTQELDLPGGTVWLTNLGGLDYFETLRQETPWRQQRNLIYGVRMKQPRLTAWYGDPDSVYRYSGVRNDPLPWSDTLTEIKREVEDLLDTWFNSALLNYYRSGRDSIGYHSDDERELGKEPIIASVSYGGVRTLRFKHRQAQYPDVEIDLPNRSLLVMMGQTQKNWKHGIDKCRAGDPRINITFRRIFSH